MSDPAGRRVLVTGAGGFIGHHLVASLLDEGYEVVAFLRYTSGGGHGLLSLLPPRLAGRYEAVLGDLRDFESVRRAMRGCSAVLHLGALIGIPYSYDSPSDVFGVNAMGTLNVLQAARDTDSIERIVITSTSEVYGTVGEGLITEEHPLRAQSPYAASKIAADQLALSFHRSFGLPVAICRPFNTFGPGQSARAVVPTIVSQALWEDRIALGSLHPVRDLSYVTDIAGAFLCMLRADGIEGRTIQFGSGEGVSVGDLAGMIIEIAGRAGLPVVEDESRIRPGASEVGRLVASTALAESLTGWGPSIGLRQGLELTVDWVSGHPGLYPSPGLYRT
ncbi:SDR family NAD(P)-dependent oxidoreductase [Candidatus Fermentibacterales bacterium]|nr:SDR family NAD(P)-dependent oxidoreductase [Candidatus Fermentibacterales bacterium]